MKIIFTFLVLSFMSSNAIEYRVSINKEVIVKVEECFKGAVLIILGLACEIVALKGLDTVANYNRYSKFLSVPLIPVMSIVRLFMNIFPCSYYPPQMDIIATIIFYGCVGYELIKYGIKKIANGLKKHDRLKVMWNP